MPIWMMIILISIGIGVYAFIGAFLYGMWVDQGERKDDALFWSLVWICTLITIVMSKILAFPANLGIQFNQKLEAREKKGE